MMQQILPSAVACVDTTTDVVTAPVAPEEREALRACSEPRRREFTTTRHCARTAMAALGVAPAGIPSGPRGEPRWPAGLTGSMTHCPGYRAAALSRTAELHALGIDAEPHRPLPAEVLTHISVPAERARLRALASTFPDIHWGTVMFSAKEAVYKAVNPLTGRWLGFRDAWMTFDPVAGTFRARLLTPGPVVDGRRLDWLTGHWLVRDGLVLTALAVRRGRAAG